LGVLFKGSSFNFTTTKLKKVRKLGFLQLLELFPSKLLSESKQHFIKYQTGDKKSIHKPETPLSGTLEKPQFIFFV
jgi:hypothetical protein